MQIDQKWQYLRSLLSDMRLAVIAYSGGVDSSLLLKAAADVLGPNLIAVTAVSDTYPPSELSHAKSFAASIGVRHRIIQINELDKEEFVRNDTDRCYHCKRELFGALRRLSESEGISFVIDGTNVDDLKDHRPGRKAAEEFGVRSPLVEAGLSKQEIRGLAQKLRLPVWDKPSLACLSSRVPYGTRITRELLQTIQSAEELVNSYGIRQVRVRHHGDIARIEIGREDFHKILSGDVPKQLAASLRDLGYTYVCLDLDGYRTGSMNERMKTASEQH